MEKYISLVLKMADLNHAEISRRAAANILAASLNESIKQNAMTESLFQAYLCLCQDTDLQIREAMVGNSHKLLQLVHDPSTEAQLFSEVKLKTYRIADGNFERTTHVITFTGD